MPYGDFSIPQKLALAATGMGSILCIVGAGVPYWVVLNLTDAGVLSPVVEASLGLWMYCDPDFHSVRIAASLCLSFATFGTVTAVCTAWCCKGSTTVCLGITCFVAGGFGTAAMGVFMPKATGFVSFGVANKHFVHYGWGLILFAICISILLLASFAACFASPQKPLSTHVIDASPTTVVAQIANNAFTAFPIQPTAQPLDAPYNQQHNP